MQQRVFPSLAALAIRTIAYRGGGHEIMIEDAMNNKILISSGLVFICVSCHAPAKSVTAVATGDDESFDLDSMTFFPSWFPAGKVTLFHGEYRAQTVPGSDAETIVKLTDKRATGILNGSKTAAFVLVTDPGGSGKFYDLALISKETEGWVNTDTVFLGDRVQIYSMSVKGDEIVLLMKTHSAKDPMCCPTLETIKRFRDKEDKLVSVSNETPAKENALSRKLIPCSF